MSPQKEDGYTAIANELMDALCKIRINGEAMQVFLFILRKTYGYNKKEDSISLSQFVNGTTLAKVSICKALNRLKEINVITQKGNDIANSYAILKDYSQWKPLPKKVTLPKKVMTVTQKGNNRYPKSDTHKQVLKDNITKDILLRNTEPSSEPIYESLEKPLKKKSEIQTSYGNNLVNKLTDVLLEVVGLSSLDGSSAKNRQFAWHVVGKIKKEFTARTTREPTEDEIVMSLKQILLKADNFTSNKITNFQYVFYHFGELILQSENPKGKMQIV